MDPLDQRLTDAGSAWRQAQPEPPDLDRMIVALRRRPSGRFTGRLMFAFVAGLLLLAAVAIAPGVGGFLQQLQPVAPVAATATPAPTARSAPTAATASPEPSAASLKSPSPSMPDAEAATDLVNRYEKALVARDWATAFDLLAPSSPTHQTGLDAFSSERAAYFASVAGRYVLGDPASVTDWTTYGPLVIGADHAHASLIEVDYPALSGNNAGFEQFVVAPDSTGKWVIWPVR
jgi:hypothetical protein